MEVAAEICGAGTNHEERAGGGGGSEVTPFADELAIEEQLGVSAARHERGFVPSPVVDLGTAFQGPHPADVVNELAIAEIERLAIVDPPFAGL